MKHSFLFWIGLVLGIVGISLVVTGTPSASSKKATIKEGFCEIDYPADWQDEASLQVTEPSPSGGPPVIRTYNLGDPRTNDSFLTFIVDLRDPGNTTWIRIVFIESSEPVDLLASSKIMARVNSNRPDYKLISLEEKSINSLYAVERIKSYRVDSDRGPGLYTLVSTYFKADHGFCSVLLVDAPWSEMQEKMLVYENIRNTFRNSK